MAVDDADYNWLSAFKWFRGGQCKHAKRGAGAVGYATASINRKLTKMEHLLLPPKPGLVIDHINRDSLDNRRANLRYLTHSQNLANSNVRSDCISGIKGVSKHSHRRGVYSVWCHIRGRRYWVGNYTDKQEASAAYVNFKELGERDPTALPPLIRNKSGVRGVTASARGWSARKMIAGKSYWLGCFQTVKDAAAAIEVFNDSQASV